MASMSGAPIGNSESVTDRTGAGTATGPELGGAAKTWKTGHHPGRRDHPSLRQEGERVDDQMADRGNFDAQLDLGGRRLRHTGPDHHRFGGDQTHRQLPRGSY